MPKGVEHARRQFAVKPRRAGPIYSVMPKGVEHSNTSASEAQNTRAPIYSVMPKGVEHYEQELARKLRTLSDILRDAERR